jgi:hypothetical protein
MSIGHPENSEKVIVLLFVYIGICMIKPHLNLYPEKIDGMQKRVDKGISF